MVTGFDEKLGDVLYFNSCLQKSDKVRMYEKGEYLVPRVTVLLDTIKEDYLIQWANSLGWKRRSYNKVLQEYAELGSEVHAEIEMFIKYGEPGYSSGCRSFEHWWKQFTELNDVTNVESEVSMSCPHFAGTADLFFTANGKNCLVDFKTSNHITYKYIMQLSAYRYMMETELHRHIDYFIIFQLDKYEVDKYQVYLYDLSNPEISEMVMNGLKYMFYLSKGFFYKTYMEQKFAETEPIAKIKDVEVKIV